MPAQHAVVYQSLVLVRLISALSIPSSNRSGGASLVSCARGFHFAAWEQPELFTSELRTAFRLRR
ncbi:MAG: hypothetical protein C5B57_12025 [Blastocatellia bacterium]|nr:MAG: hypothetical protein C5B57_12025 [Blastocatellia bacterium]